jgi:hypothetical protein
MSVAVVVGRSAADEGAPSAKATYQVPYRLTPLQHVMIRAKINGQGPFNFIMDTGAPVLFIATDVAQRIGIKPDRDDWANLDRFEIEGGVVVRKVRAKIETPFQLEGINGLGLGGVTLHGIVGYDVLARFRLDFDFTRDKMGWTPLDFTPAPPNRLTGKGGAPGGLDALGSVLKFLGNFLGKKTDVDTVARGFLGVEVADADDGVVIKSVLPGSPAERAELKPGDRIRQLQGKKVRTSADLGQLAASLAAGKTARLELSRGGASRQVKVKLAEGL